MSLAQLEIASPIVIFTAALIFILLERIFPYNPGQRLFRDGFWNDLIGYGVIQSYLMGVFIAWLIYFIDHHTGLSRFKLVNDWPIWLQLTLFVVWHDLNTYLIHRYQHRSKILWRTHEAHHAAEQVDFLSGIQSHSLEILIYQTIEFLPVILLGASPEIPLYKGMANAIYGMYIHANLSWRMGKWLYVFNGPELHRWHHSKALNRNFATKFSLWDHLFGTLFSPTTTAVHYGFGQGKFPKGWLRQHIYAFRPFPRRKKAPAPAETSPLRPLQT